MIQQKHSNILPGKQDDTIWWIKLIKDDLPTLGTPPTKTSRVGSLEITSFSLNSVAFGTWTMIRHHHHHPYFNKLARVRAPHCHYLRSMDKGIDWHSHAQDGTVIHYLISMNKGTPHKLELCALRKTFINYWHSLFPQFFIFFFSILQKNITVKNNKNASHPSWKPSTEARNQIILS